MGLISLGKRNSSPGFIAPGGVITGHSKKGWSGHGFTPFGAKDPGIIFSHPLTREITTEDIAGLWTTRFLVGSGSLPTIDAKNGTKFHDGAANAGYRFQTASEVVRALDMGGQISFKVSRLFVTQVGGTNSVSKGHLPSTTQYCMSYNPGTGSSGLLARKSGSSGVFATTVALGQCDRDNLNFPTTLGTAVGFPMFNSYHKDDYVTVNIGWSGNMRTGSGRDIWMGVDGYPLTYGQTAETIDTLLENFYLGSDRGLANTFMNNHWMKDLQISTTPPSWPSMSEDLYVLSDSLFDPVVYDNTTSFYDNIARYALQGTLVRLTGRHLDAIEISENSGFGIGTYMGGSQLGSAGALASGRTMGLVVAGTNDANHASYSGSTYSADLLNLFEELFFTASKASRSSFKKVVLMGPPPKNDAVADTTERNNLRDIRERNRAFIDAWRIAYPDEANAITYVDLYDELGSDHRLAVVADFPEHTNDGTHMADSWQYRIGYMAALALLGRAIT